MSGVRVTDSHPALEWIRSRYQVPAFKGDRVRYTYNDREGTIVDAENGYLVIRLDGDDHTGNYHPTWEMEYLGEPKERSSDG